MKKTIYTASLSLLLCAAACSHTRFEPVPAPNLWADDYTGVSSMDQYRAWGTYNVHDPAVCKVADTFYMYSTDAIFRENRKEARKRTCHSDSYRCGNRPTS